MKYIRRLAFATQDAPPEGGGAGQSPHVPSLAMPGLTAGHGRRRRGAGLTKVNPAAPPGAHTVDSQAPQSQLAATGCHELPRPRPMARAHPVSPKEMVHRKGVEGSEGPGQGVWPTVGQREARSGEDMDAAGGLHPAQYLRFQQ